MELIILRPTTRDAFVRMIDTKMHDMLGMVADACNVQFLILPPEVEFERARERDFKFNWKNPPEADTPTVITPNPKT